MCKNILTSKMKKTRKMFRCSLDAWKNVGRIILHYLNYLPLLAAWYRERYYGDSWKKKKKV